MAKMDVGKLLNDDWTKKTKSGHEREATLLEEIKAEASKNVEVLEAKVRVSGRKVEEALASGDFELVEKLKQDAQQAQKELDERSEKITSKSLELKEVRNQIEKTGEKVLAELFPEINAAADQKLNEAISFREDAWKSIQGFGHQAGVPVSSNYLRRLMLFDRDGSKTLYEKIKRWIGTPIS